MKFSTLKTILNFQWYLSIFSLFIPLRVKSHYSLILMPAQRDTMCSSPIGEFPMEKIINLLKSSSIFFPPIISKDSNTSVSLYFHYSAELFFLLSQSLCRCLLKNTSVTLLCIRMHLPLENVIHHPWQEKKKERVNTVIIFHFSISPRHIKCFRRFLGSVWSRTCVKSQPVSQTFSKYICVYLKTNKQT